MKIAVIGSRGYPYVYSGYETFVKETFELLANKYEVHIYCHAHLFTKKPKKVNDINLHYIPSIKGKFFAQLSNSFFSTLHAITIGNYDVILYVNTANGPFGILTKLFRTKTVIITDGLEWLRPKWKGLGAKYFFWASKLSTKVFDVLISDSEEMRKIYLKLFNADSEVIEYGANIKYSHGISKIKNLSLEKDQYYLVVARLVPDNNADIIVESFRHANTDKKLVVIGDVPYKDDYADTVKSHASDKIIFLGYVYDQDLLMELYANAYMYIHGHEYGGTNPSLLKALACGCSVLALDTRFNREVLLNDDYGNYFTKNIKSLTLAIDYLDKNPKHIAQQRHKARNRIIDKYTWPIIADKYDQLFIKMVKNKC